VSNACTANIENTLWKEEHRLPVDYTIRAGPDLLAAESSQIVKITQINQGNTILSLHIHFIDLLCEIFPKFRSAPERSKPDNRHRLVYNLLPKWQAHCHSTAPPKLALK
jgi:hypothetical protein